MGKAKNAEQCFFTKKEKSVIENVVVDVDLSQFPFVIAHISGFFDPLDTIPSGDGDPSGFITPKNEKQGTFQVHAVNEFDDMWIHMAGKYTCEDKVVDPSACVLKKIVAKYFILNNFTGCTSEGKFNGKMPPPS